MGVSCACKPKGKPAFCMPGFVMATVGYLKILTAMMRGAEHMRRA